MRVMTSIAVAALLASGLAMPAQANDKGRTLAQDLRANENRFKRVDTNGDNLITPDEYLVERTRIAERDGKPVSGLSGGAFGTDSDTDGDGAVSLAESEVYVRAQFASRDANGDGRVTEAEIAASRAR